MTEHKNRLEEMKRDLESELATLGIHNPDTDDWEADFGSDYSSESDDNLIGDQAEAAEERIATLALLETRYRNIVRALTKIEMGTYGICEVSGEPIEADRLSANPAARTCQKHMDDEGLLPL